MDERATVASPAVQVLDARRDAPLEAWETTRDARLTVGLARSAAEVEDAQRLRYKVFAEEMGARIDDGGSGLDRDAFDPWCDHIIVRDADSLRVVGTYRVLPPHAARELGRLYSETEFDLARLQHLRPALIEVGRSCVHRDYRAGGAILLLWAGLAQYMRQAGYRHLVGCASASLADGGMQAARLRDELQAYMTDAEYRVFPRLPFPHEQLERAAQCEMPPLIKGYLRLGAKVCGEPAWDPDFNTADFLIWLSLDNLHKRYARHFDLLAQQGASISATLKAA
jgi:putative hemolysin